MMQDTQEFQLINAKCMVYGHAFNDDGICTRESCYAEEV